MKHIRRRSSLAAAVALLATALLGAAARAQAPVSFSIFRGETGGNVQLGSWGSGRAESVKDNVLVGDAAIRITTMGLYQGARLDFSNPVDLAPAFANPKTYVRLQARFTGTSGYGNTDPNDPFVQKVLVSPFQRMRFLLTMADGTQYELIRPVSLPPTEDPDAYVPISFPVSSLLKTGGGNRPAPAGEGTKLKSLGIFGDVYQQFQVGEIGVVTDDTDIDVAPLEEQIAYVGDELSFAGNANGGASTLKYSWDFNDRDGIQEDATGRVVTHIFRAPGKVKVTLTVSDVDGIKPPKTESVELDVNQ